MRSAASVDSASGYAFANSVDTLAETVVLNYMALHDNIAPGVFNSPSSSIFANLSAAELDKYIAFESIVSGTL